MTTTATLARRVLPEDPALRALLIAQHARKITGRQRQWVTCWFCGTEHAERRFGEDGWTAGPHGEPVCGDQDACNDRAAEAGLVLVLGDPQSGGDAA